MMREFGCRTDITSSLAAVLHSGYVQMHRQAVDPASRIYGY
jgi:hypothetical protein